ncbi:hypothetical protein MIR68_003855 [Amoeboaphelidium protococcarum]|nr:hypothetical protein MIR68_003855 [Amoeboaphelidium protococcarum]
MHLTPQERDKLQISQIAKLAQTKLLKKKQLNYIEATALICHVLLGHNHLSVSKLMDIGRIILGPKQVTSMAITIVKEIQIEICLRDGVKLVTIHDPFQCFTFENAFFDCPDLVKDDKLPAWINRLEWDCPDNVPIRMLVQDQNESKEDDNDSTKIMLNKGQKRVRMRVVNMGDRAVQVGSHFPLLEVNPQLKLNRAIAYDPSSLSGEYGPLRLDIAAGCAVRFEPGEEKYVNCVSYTGQYKIIEGGNGLGKLVFDGGQQKWTKPDLQTVMDRVTAGRFLHDETKPQVVDDQNRISKSDYFEVYGPTVGQKMRLADTNLVVEIEKDLCAQFGYGDECVFGGGKGIREGMCQCGLINDDGGIGILKDCAECYGGPLDLCITNCVIIDYTGIYKADVGVKDGKIRAIGKAGNPSTMKVSPGMVIGVCTEIMSGEGKILTAGGIDTHVHFICPQLMETAICSGLTTLIGGGTGINTGTCATTCTPGKFHIRTMLQAVDNFPLNIGLTGKGNSSCIEPLIEQIEAGAIGLKLHEDWGSTPSAIDTCLSACDKYDVQCTIHTDTLNESGFLSQTLMAIKGRTIHFYHSEGAGGGHVPDIIECCSFPYVIPSSTNPTRPYTVNTVDEHLDMLMVCHHLNKNIPEDVAFAESRIRGETIGAEDYLQDVGAISIISSDSQAMGRIGEVIIRTWQTAHKMKEVCGELLPDGVSSPKGNDNFRVKRYVAKYTINPALAHGVAHHVGSVEVGKLADLVLWKPEFFGVKPEVVFKGGVVTYAQVGDPNASIPTPQPSFMRPMFGASPSVVQSGENSNCLTFVSKHSLHKGDIARKYGLQKKVVAVEKCRSVTKADMKLNNFTPKIEVDPETFQVKVDGKVIRVEPTSQVPLSSEYFIF